LAHAASEVPEDLADLCDRLIAQVGPATIVDDITLVAVRRLR
jgi:hypothetical protein